MSYTPKRGSPVVDETITKLSDVWKTAKQLNIDHAILNACVEYGLAESCIRRTAEVDPRRIGGIDAKDRNPRKTNYIRKHYRLKL